MLKHLFTIRREEGQPIQSGDITLTPVSQALVVEFPGGVGGFTWNRPVGVRVDVPGQEQRFLPVVDVTRRTVWTIFGAMFGSLLIVWLLRRR
ncbi:MAG TPA: hypothetical protein PJ988_19755 [Anaerolinea sp.]|nr:hypothetical protein [Anaerolinea sp.]